MKSIEIQKQCGLTSTLHSLCNGHGVWDKTHLASSYNFRHPCNTIKDLTCHSGDGKNDWPYISTRICIRMIQVSVSISSPGRNIGDSDSGFNLTVIALLTSSDGRWIWRDSPGRRIFRGYELPATPAIASARPRVAGAQVFLNRRTSTWLLFGYFVGTSINLIYLSAMNGKLPLPAELDSLKPLQLPKHLLVEFNFAFEVFRDVSCT